ncbi:hypothetical protein FQN57_006621 [Myotisia sp. PD_48]|nr:hypothetical protein FQN57_006621 [Myotisia sp. PD_48]
MSTTLSSTAPSSSAMCGTPLQYQIPIEDAACAIPNKGDNDDLMEKCCKSASVQSYNNDCALYCLARDQSVKDLTDCLYNNKLPWADVWCNGVQNATATNTDIPSETGSRPTRTDDSDDSDETATSTQASSTATQTDAAAHLTPIAGVNTKAGLALCFIVIPAIFAGAFL